MNETHILRHWAYSFRPAWLRWSIAGLLFILTGCTFSFGRSEPTPTPFVAPTYQPPAQITPAVISTPAPAAAVEGGNVNIAPAASSRLGYSGEILAEQQVAVVVEVGGQVLKLEMEVGDQVQAGDLLLMVDSTILEAQRAQALAGLEAAQAQLDLLLLQADERDLEAARAAVAAAEAAYQRALDGPTGEDLTLAETQLRQAEAAVKRAQAAYNQVSWNPVVAALPESLQLEQATLALEAAQAQYDKIVKGPTADVIAGAYAQLAAARAQLQRLEEGPKSAQIQAAQAQVHQAETALYLAQLQLDKAAVRAPIDGVVARVNTSAGAMAAPGTAAAVLLSREVKIVIAVEELRLARLRVGQPAIIRVDAYPDREFPGTIATIAPELDSSTRTVQATIRPTGDASGLTPGMFATVELLEEEVSGRS